MGTEPALVLSSCETGDEEDYCDIGCSGIDVRKTFGGTVEFDALWWLKGHEFPTGTFGWSFSPDDGFGLSVGAVIYRRRPQTIADGQRLIFRMA